jgi:hypothetical protein
MDKLSYQNQSEKTKDNLEKNKELLEDIERWEQQRFEKKVIEDTENFWTCE